jgi:hypothetical protein
MKNRFLPALAAIVFAMPLAMCSKSSSNKIEDGKPDGTTYKYYRIKQVDKNGKVSYSLVKKIKR